MPSTATSSLAVSSIADVRAAVAKARGDAARIGFVPTMGALHRGHLSLVERARKESDMVVMSIFVNPLQFGPSEDFSRYPRPLEHDAQVAADAGVDILFTPSVEEMYRQDRLIAVTAGTTSQQWEGAVRPGHFDGVLTVVAKLFNIVQPDVAVFGRKDLQQAALVKAMVRDLDFALRMIVAPTVREEDGLALSSRNTYLSPEQRHDALALVQSLRAASAVFEEGERDIRAIETAGWDVLSAAPQVKVDYFAVVNSESFAHELVAAPGSAVIVAGRVGPTRLIDNIMLGENDQD